MLHKALTGGWKKGGSELVSQLEPLALHLHTGLVSLVVNYSHRGWWANCHSSIHPKGYTFASGSGFASRKKAMEWAENQAIEAYSKDLLNARYPNMIQFRK